MWHLAIGFGIGMAFQRGEWFWLIVFVVSVIVVEFCEYKIKEADDERSRRMAQD
jgi:hypothetical protein